MEMKIKPSDLRAQAQRMINSDQMPALDQVLSAVADTRERYRNQILESRKQNSAGTDALKGD